jgi:predicted nucleic acid-binding protein
MIDLRKTVLLDAFARLPYKILIPDLLFEQEFVKFTHTDRIALTNNGVQIVDLSETEVERVINVQSQNIALSIHDCFAFVVAENHPGGILLTGDKGLRSLSVRSGIETHGVLWIIDEIHKHGLVKPRKLHEALIFLEKDDTVRLPAKELKTLIRKFENLLYTLDLSRGNSSKNSKSSNRGKPRGSAGDRIL